MADISFPQKSSFGTITATRVNTTIVDNPAGDLSIRRMNAEQLGIAAAGTIYRNHLVLAATFQLQDASLAALIDPDDAGSIAGLAPITDALGVRTAVVNNPLGTLTLQRMGSNGMSVGAAQVSFTKDIRLVTGYDIVDDNLVTLLGGDASGNVDELGRIDDAVKTPATSHYIASSIGALVSPVQTGTINEATGVWSSDVDDILYVFLGALMGRVQLNATVHIDSIKVFYKTEHNDAYVDFGRVYRNSMVGVSTVLIGDNSTNNGDGNTLQDVFTIPVDEAMIANFDYYIEIQVEATAGIVKIYGIEVTYHTT